jgi:nucleoside-diphosphate-sugar epimerase
MTKLIVGCGYLGQRVAALWRGAGHTVRATTRNHRRAEEFRALGIEPVVCDVLDPASLRALPEAETVLYSVGLDRAAGRSMREVYVDGLRNVLAVGKFRGEFVYISSTSVYGQTNGEAVDEDAATEPVEESGHIVLEAERLLVARFPAAVRLRLAGIYGPGRVLRRQAVALGEPLVGDGDKWLNLIQVDDAAGTVLAAEEPQQRGRVYNVADDEPVRRRDFYGLMATLLGAPPPRFTPPGPGAPSTGHDKANRRIVNRRLRQDLGVELAYPTYRVGLPAAVGA